MLADSTRIDAADSAGAVAAHQVRKTPRVASDSVRLRRSIVDSRGVGRCTACELHSWGVSLKRNLSSRMGTAHMLMYKLIPIAAAATPVQGKSCALRSYRNQLHSQYLRDRLNEMAERCCRPTTTGRVAASR